MGDSRAFFSVAALAVAVSSSACLSQSHVIPKGELVALAQVAPEQRGKRVRVVQGFYGAEDPPEAPRAHAGASVVVVSPAPAPAPARRRHGRPSAKLSKESSKYWFIVAAAAALGLAATEGARYDGWVELHPMHPVHLYGPYGEYTWVPLAQLDPARAAWAQKAFVRPSEGPWTPLGRAPLSRRGFTYSVYMGATEIPSVYGGEESGFLGRIQLGFFPTQAVGLLFDIGTGWRNNEVGKTIFDTRNGFELEVLPLTAGRLHAGGYGQLGLAYRIEDGPADADNRSIYYGGGGLLQLELTTRLALSARAGIAVLHDATISDVGLGLSIY